MWAQCQAKKGDVHVSKYNASPMPSGIPDPIELLTIGAKGVASLPNGVQFRRGCRPVGELLCGFDYLGQRRIGESM